MMKRLSTLLIESQEEVRSDLRSRKFAQTDQIDNPGWIRTWRLMSMAIRNRFPKTASGPESLFSLTRQAQTNRYDRRIRLLWSELLTSRVHSLLSGTPCAHISPENASKNDQPKI
jgi:hypothetical protein